MAEQLEQLEKQVADMKAQLEGLAGRTPENKISMVVFSGDLDKALAAFVIATGARAMGMDVDSVHEAGDAAAAVEGAEALFIGGGNTFRLVKELHGQGDSHPGGRDDVGVATQTR